MIPIENPSPEAEGQHHTFVTHRIPWFVHLLWVVYWVMSISYILYYQFPVIQRELMNPP